MIRDNRRRRSDPGGMGYSNMEVDELQQDFELSFRKGSMKWGSNKMNAQEVTTPGLSSSDTLVNNTPEVDTFKAGWTWSRPVLRGV